MDVHYTKIVCQLTNIWTTTEMVLIYSNWYCNDEAIIKIKVWRLIKYMLCIDGWREICDRDVLWMVIPMYSVILQTLLLQCCILSKIIDSWPISRCYDWFFQAFIWMFYFWVFHNTDHKFISGIHIQFCFWEKWNKNKFRAFWMVFDSFYPY